MWSGSIDLFVRHGCRLRCCNESCDAQALFVRLLEAWLGCIVRVYSRVSLLLIDGLLLFFVFLSRIF